MNEELKEELGLLADKCDNLLAAGQLAMPANIHIEGLQGGVKDIAQKLRQLIGEPTL